MSYKDDRLIRIQNRIAISYFYVCFSYDYTQSYCSVVLNLPAYTTSYCMSYTSCHDYTNRIAVSYCNIVYEVTEPYTTSYCMSYMSLPDYTMSYCVVVYAQEADTKCVICGEVFKGCGVGLVLGWGGAYGDGSGGGEWVGEDMVGQVGCGGVGWVLLRWVGLGGFGWVFVGFG